LQPVERTPEGQGDFLSTRGRDHAFRAANEQIVSQHPAQPNQGVTYRRLAEAKTLAGTRDISLLHHRVEHDEQIEIQRSPLHSTRGHWRVSSLIFTMDMYQ
jgi:hypothetical protein